MLFVERLDTVCGEVRGCGTGGEGLICCMSRGSLFDAWRGVGYSRDQGEGQNQSVAESEVNYSNVYWLSRVGGRRTRGEGQNQRQEARIRA